RISSPPSASGRSCSRSPLPTAIARPCWKRSPASIAHYGTSSPRRPAAACASCSAASPTRSRSSRSAATTWRARRPPISAARCKPTGRAGRAGCRPRGAGRAPGAGAERVAAARKAAGPVFILAVDANRGGTAEEAIEFAALVEPLAIRWFEEPCHWYDDVAQMARVRTKMRIPVTAGQSEITSHGVRRLIDAGAVDIVNYDASEGGGVTDWRRAAALCAAAGVQVAHLEESQIAQHLISAIPHGTYVECFADPDRDPVWQHMWLNRPPIVDGMMAVSAGPGFGLELDARMIAEYRVA